MLDIGVTINSKPVKDFNPATKDQVSKWVHNQMIHLWKAGVREFIDIVIDHINVDTGMSMASLSPLAAKVSFKNILEATLAGRGPRLPRSKGYTKLDGTWVPDVLKSPALGRSLGQKAYTLNFGTPKNALLTFSFDIKVFQYALHETGGGSTGAWESLNAGKVAMISYIESNYENHISSKKLLEFIFNGGIIHG